MLFLHPKWDDENQRIGKQECTSAGYILHQVSDLISLSGFLILLGILVYFVGTLLWGDFQSGRLWWLIVPIVVDFCGDLLYSYSWWLAERKDFHYDYPLQRATWIENGERRSYPPES